MICKSHIFASGTSTGQVARWAFVKQTQSYAPVVRAGKLPSRLSFQCEYIDEQ